MMRSKKTLKSLELADIAQKATEQVNQKNSEIRSILQNITQGIFIIGLDHKIQSQYSPHLESIFRIQNHCRTGDVVKLILEKSNLLPDEVSTVEEVLKISIGMDVLNFKRMTGTSQQSFSLEPKIEQRYWRPIGFPLLMSLPSSGL